MYISKQYLKTLMSERNVSRERLADWLEMSNRTFDRRLSDGTFRQCEVIHLAKLFRVSWTSLILGPDASKDGD